MSKKRKHIVVNPEIHKKIKQKAMDDDISMEEVTNKILKKVLKKEG